MRKSTEKTARSKSRQIKVKKFTEIFIQEYLRKFRPEVIIKAISNQYLVPEQTIRSYIKPAKIKSECENGKHKIDSQYKSIL